MANEPHALLVVFPSAGHVNPMLQFASRLLDHGFAVTLAISDAFSSKLKLNPALHLIIYPDPNLHLHNIYPFIFSDQACIREPVINFLEGPSLESKNKLCIIFDQASFTWVPDLAQAFKIPCAILFTISVAGVIAIENLPRLISDVAAADAKGQKDGIISRISGLLPLAAFDIPEYVRSVMAAGPSFEQKQAVAENVTWRLVNSFEELEQDALQAANVVPVGPIVPEAVLAEEDLKICDNKLQEDFPCLEWLDRQAPSSVLYISFGSVSTISILQVNELIQALTASNQPFLWAAFRPNLVSDAPNFYMQDLQKLKESIDHLGMITGWAPQIKVLGHKSVGGFLTHGGWNSILESICMGVPMLGWPSVAEQHLNCKYIADGWKVGVRISKDGLIKKEEILELISRLMKDEEGKEMRRRAMELRQLARKSWTVEGSSLKNLVAFKEALLMHNN